MFNIDFSLVNKIDAEKSQAYKLTRLSAVKNENTKRISLLTQFQLRIRHHELTEYLNIFDSETSRVN